MPLLTDRLPEGWSLPSYLSAVVQIACIGPLIYSILHKCSKVTLPTAPLIFCLLVFCCFCTSLMVFFWPVTYVVFSKERSVVLIVLLFGMALVNSTSNVLFMPYMSTFHPPYLTAYFVGMGLSALFPSLVSIAQGSSDECVMINGTMVREKIPPRFDVSHYNVVMLTWMTIATISFMLLHWTRCGNDNNGNSKNADIKSDLPVDEASPLNRYADMSTEDDKKIVMSRWRFAYMLFLMTIINAQMNGIIPSIQSYATLPYSQATYHLSLTLSNIASPAICFLPLVIQPKNLCSITGLTLLSSTLSAVIVSLAAMSPTPILQYSILGKILVVSVSVCACALHSYLRTAFATILRQGSEDSESRLFWCGVFIQIGSFLGSSIMFPLVNVFKLFTSAPPCPS